MVQAEVNLLWICGGGRVSVGVVCGRGESKGMLL